MEKDWKRVFLSGQLYKVEIAKDLLENNGIESVILTRKIRHIWLLDLSNYM